LEWKITYVGNAEDSSLDQVLEEVMVGPVNVGVHRFVLESPPPNPALIANEDLIGVTVILITCSYMDQRFIQIGYYVSNEYMEPYDPESPPNPVDIKKLRRSILHSDPRVTRFSINWSGSNSALPPAEAEEPCNDEEDVLDLNMLDANREEFDDEMEEVDEESVEGDVDLGVESEADEEGEDEGEEGMDPLEGETSAENYSPQIMNEDSNSLDIARMIQ
jgi:histone chaperone ASF1